MNKRKELERKRRSEMMKHVRRKNRGNFWLSFSQYLRPWLKQLTARYKERGEFAVFAAWLLPSYYQNPDDVEVAALVAMLIKDDDKVLEHTEEFRQLIGESPFEWFINRRFIPLSIGHEQLRTTGGVLNGKIAEYLNLFHYQWLNRKVVVVDIFSHIFCKSKCDTKISLLYLVLASSDGFGKGVWNIDKRQLRCPMTASALSLMKTFWPDYLSYGSFDDAVGLFGFEYDSDFFYAALAYERLQKERPAECRRLSTLYQKRYKDVNLLGAQYWNGKRDGILPELE